MNRHQMMNIFSNVFLKLSEGKKALIVRADFQVQWSPDIHNITCHGVVMIVALHSNDPDAEPM